MALHTHTLTHPLTRTLSLKNTLKNVISETTKTICVSITKTPKLGMVAHASDTSTGSSEFEASLL